MFFWGLDTFKIEFTLAGFFKLPIVALRVMAHTSLLKEINSE